MTLQHKAITFIPPGSSYSNIFPFQHSCSTWTAQLGLLNDPLQRGAVAGSALLHTLVTPTFHLRNWAPALQTHQAHPSAPDRMLAPSPVYSSAGKTTNLQGKQPWARAEGAVGTPAPGYRHPHGLDGRDGARAGLCLHVAARELGQFVLLPPRQETRLRHVRRLP